MGLAHVRRVPRPHRRHAGTQRGLPRRPLDHPARRDGRARDAGRGDGRRPRRDARAARREPRGGRFGVLVELGPHAQRRGRRHGAVAIRERGRDRRAVRRRQEPPRHHPRVHPVRGHVRGLRAGTAHTHVARGQSSGQLERAVRRQGQRVDHRAQPRGVRLRHRARRPRRRADRALLALSPYLLRQRLPPRHHPGLGEADGATARGEEGDARVARRSRRAARGRAAADNRLQGLQLGRLRDQRDLRRREQAVGRQKRRRDRKGARRRRLRRAVRHRGRRRSDDRFRLSDTSRRRRDLADPHEGLARSPGRGRRERRRRPPRLPRERSTTPP